MSHAVSKRAGRELFKVFNTACFQATSDTKFQSYNPKLAYFFPGQGAQTVGMAKVVYSVTAHPSPSS